MQWHIFTYDAEKSKGFDYIAWLDRLLNGLHAENVYTVSKNVVAIYHPANYDDTFNALGNPL